MYGITCWCTVIIGMEAPTLMKIPLAKRYYGAEKTWSLRDMHKAEQLAQDIEQCTLNADQTADKDLLKVLIRCGKDEAVAKLITERNIMPDLDALQEAIAYKRNFLALLFLDCVHSLAKEQNSIGTVLHIASLFNNIEVARLMLDLKIVDVNAVSQNKDTALHLATRKGHKEMVVFLCERGANPFALHERKHAPSIDAMDIAYRYMDKMCMPTEFPQDVPDRKQHYREILHILYKYVQKFGGSVNTVYVK